MLLRFGVTNDHSIRDTQELSLVASSLKDDETGLIRPANLSHALVPAAIIYGANASGKSNVIRALEFMRKTIRSSHFMGEICDGLDRSPFRLSPSTPAEPTTYDVDFIVNGVRYHYGFSFNDETFLSEWLYAFPSGRRQMLFDRNGANFTFGRALKGRNHVIADLTRENSLFLSAAAQNAHEQLTQIRTGMAEWIFDTEISASPSRIRTRYKDASDGDIRIIDLLDKFGTGICGIGREIRQRSGDHGSATRILLGLDNAGDDDYEVFFDHRTSEGSFVPFTLMEESDGTRRLLLLLSSALRALDRGGLLVIDELSSSLHTMACEAIVALFSDPKTNPKGAQLIATTHDTNLLRSPLLRRDQIWFTEKDAGGATHLYPLSDFHTRAGDNFEKGYLQGRFGAVPFSGDVRDLLGREG